MALLPAAGSSLKASAAPRQGLSFCNARTIRTESTPMARATPTNLDNIEPALAALVLGD
jgi:hypothetical protein